MKTNQVRFINPSFPELDDAYRGLAQGVSLVVSTNRPEATLEDMEKSGFVAMRLLAKSGRSDQTIIEAYKGKHGPCYFQGDTVILKGLAVAALDDDLHLLIKEKPVEVCEKTRRVLSLPPYHSTVVCQLKEKHFNFLKDFEESISFLPGLLPKNYSHSAGLTTIFYPGPFRLLILRDGSMVRRGKCSNIPADLASDLIREEVCRPCPSDEEQKPEYFQENYALYGALFMQENSPLKPVTVAQNLSADFTSLASIDPALKTRLEQAIAKQKKYFVLVGSDMYDAVGCCPSSEVTDANRLVRFGVLSSLSTPTTQDSCPVTVYAFRNELATDGSGFKTTINHDFRKEVEEILHRKTYGGWQSLLKWALLAFVSISFVLAVKQCRELTPATLTEKEVVSLLNPEGKKQVSLILFHSKKRCFQCLEMERQTMEIVQSYFSSESAKGHLVFKGITMDEPPFNRLAERYQLFAATLVLISFDGEKILKEKPLWQRGNLYRDEQAFKTQLSKDIHEALLYD